MPIFNNRNTLIFASLLTLCFAAACSPDKTENYKAEESPNQIEINKEVELETPEKPQQTDTAYSYLIADSVAGRLQIGMPTDTIEQLFSAGKLNKSIKMQEGMVFTVYEINNRNGELSLIAEELCKPDCYITRITVKDPRYKTVSGIGVGSTYAEIKSKHAIKFVSGAEGNLVVVPQKPLISFVLDKSQIDKNLLVNPKPDQIPDSVRVISVLVY